MSRGILSRAVSRIEDIRWKLAADARLLPLSRFSEETVRRMLGRTGVRNSHVFFRPRSRSGPALIDDDLRRLLERFRRPSTVLSVVARTAEEEDARPVALLRRVTPLLERFVRQGSLVRADRPDDVDLSRIEPSLKVSSLFAGVRILAPLSTTIDTEVYLARSNSGSKVVLKVSRPRFSTERAAKRARERLEREFSLLRALRGGPAPKLMRSGSSKGRAFGIMEWIDGPCLDRFAAQEAARDRTSGIRATVGAVCGALDALAKLHDRGFMHGDIHPRNFLVAEGRTRLIDLGLARRVEPELGGSRSGFSGIVQFLPPEAAEAALTRGRHFLRTPRGEVYSMGALAFHAMTGQHYFPEQTALREAHRSIASGSVRSFESVGAPAWPEVEAVIRKALSKKPSHRFSSVSDFRRALAAAAASSAPARSRASRAPRGSEARELAGFIERETDWFRTLRYEDLRQLQAAPHASAAFGGAGVAYALLRAAQRFDAPDLLAQAANWISRAVEDLESPTALYSSDGDVSPRRVPDCSIFYGEPGVRVTEALIAQAMDAETVRGQALTRLATFLERACRGPMDLYFGAPGWLTALAVLRQEIADPRLASWGERLARASDRALPWDSNRFFGFAHGIAGNAFARLQWAGVDRSQAPEGLHRLLGRLARAGVRRDRGLNWPIRRSRTRRRFLTTLCHGSPGMIFALTEGSRAFNDPSLLEFARAAGRSTQADSASNETLCCGSTGQGYALLALDRADPGRGWREQAVRLALRSARNARRIEGPFGLLKGRAGELLFALDAVAADGDRFGCPMIEAVGG